MKPLGTRQQPGAAVRYKVRDDYRRFDQKNHLIYQGEWNPVFAGLSRADLRRAREEKLKRSLPGFTRLDWAYQMAATANCDAARFVINVPNSGGTSWRGIAKTAIGSEAIEGLPEYQVHFPGRIHQGAGASRHPQRQLHGNKHPPGHRCRSGGAGSQRQAHPSPFRTPVQNLQGHHRSSSGGGQPHCLRRDCFLRHL